MIECLSIIETVLDDNQRRICGAITNEIDGWIGPPYLLIDGRMPMVDGWRTMNY